MKMRKLALYLPIFLITFSLNCCPESETDSKIEPGLKLIVIADEVVDRGGTIELQRQVTEIESNETRKWQLPAEVDQTVVSVSAGPQGQLLLVQQDGVVGVVSGEETKEYTQIAEDGLAAAWSNDGQQIAIVHETFSGSNVPQSLEILDADFNTLWTETIVLPGNYGGEVLSWSADDRLVAISRASRLSGRYLIVDVSAREVFLKEGYSSVFFVGSRMLAGRHLQGEYSETQVSEIQVAQVELQADGVEIVTPTTIVGPAGPAGGPADYELLVSASLNPARLVIWKGNIWLNFPYTVEGPCRILDEQGRVLAEMPEVFFHNDAYCLTRSEAE